MGKQREKLERERQLRLDHSQIACFDFIYVAVHGIININILLTGKDATFFILKVTEHPPLYAFELYSHPAWFMRHLKHKPHRLVLRRVNEASREVMDSTFYLAPSRCRTHIKHGKQSTYFVLLPARQSFNNGTPEHC